MSKVLAMGGSMRKDGNTNKALQFVLDILSKNGIETELIPLCDVHIDLETCQDCPTCWDQPAACIGKDDFPPIFQKMIKADGIILGAPVYWGSAPAKLMQALHRAGMEAEGRISADKPIPDRAGWPDTKGPGLFAKKLGAVVSTTRRTGANFTLAQIWSWFFLLDFIVIGSSYWPMGLELPIKLPIIKDGKVTMIETNRPRHPKDLVEVDIEFRHTLVNLAENFVWALDKLKD